MKTLACIIILLLSVACFSQQDTSSVNCKPCRKHPGVIGPAFKIRGVLSYWNGAPGVRIWKVGTKRILGVSEGRFYREGYCNLPKWLPTITFDEEITGDFVLYPFTKDKPEEMRLVCIDTVYNMKVRKRK